MVEMSGYNYTSGVGHLIEQFVEQKHAAGYPYISSARILYNFDQMISESYPGAQTITKEMCNSWLRIKADEHPNGLIRRITPIRQLCKYLNGIGICAYIIPGHMPSRQIKYQPHIYTDNELKAFFHNIDAMCVSPYTPLWHMIGPAIFRMIYGCGLRSSEARNLSMEDVDLETGKVIIRESKGWKMRVLYMSESLTEQCRLYNEQMEKVMPDRRMFFPDKHGGCISKESLQRIFHKAWDMTPESRQISGNKARIHDFRHSYAVRRVNQWVREESDLSALYPYLSEYLGHSQYEDTDYYLHLVDDFYPILESRMEKTNNNVLPKLADNEEEK